MQAEQQNPTHAGGRIKVKVADGWVTLDGEVDFNFLQKAAENAVRYLTGV